MNNQTRNNHTNDAKTNVNSNNRNYWESQYNKEPYYEAGRTFGDYESAYRTGYEGRTRYQDRNFQAAESDLKNDWESTKGSSALSWNNAKNAVKAAWDRADQNMPGNMNKNNH